MKSLINLPIGMLVAAVMSSCTMHSSNPLPELIPDSIAHQSEEDLIGKIEYLKIPSPLEDLAPLEKEGKITSQERNTLEFMYAYMITPDMMDYPLSFHLANVRASIKAREEMPWGREIPADIYRHFVLPLRINNEAIDSVRIKLYDQLKPVVKGLNMEQAVLALNHWCHKHVTYQPSDARTSSPLTTMRNALGRCGEESTFTVAVLRTMGIPARQVYTPRWAHTDDNHAWVEAWVNGKWRYLGACEPSPVLDHAWFDAPVLRAMMLDTKVFGKYHGPDEVLSQHPTYTVINVTPNYVPTAKAMVRVVHPDGTPAVGVPVSFRLYNYAELFPLAVRQTDSLGRASVRLGLGDIVVIAGNKPDEMGFLKYTVGAKENDPNGNLLKLEPYSNWPTERHLKLTPPIAKRPKIFNDTIAINSCNREMVSEDSVRMAYIATFPTPEDANKLINQLGLERDSDLAKIVYRQYIESRGNHKTIEKYLTSLPQNRLEYGIKMLENLTAKDMHDITLEVLKSYTPMENIPYIPYVSDPRIANEKLFPLSSFIKDFITNQVASRCKEKHPSRAERVEAALEMINNEYRVDNRYNPIAQPISAEALIKYGVGDPKSLQIQLIRACRLVDVPAIWDETIGAPAYFDENAKEVIINTSLNSNKPTESNGKEGVPLRLTYTPQGYIKTPKYYTNFTIGFIDQNGDYGTYEYSDNLPYNSDQLKTSLIHQDNFINTGTRMADGSVLMSIRKIKDGTTTPIIFDQDKTQVSVIGSMNPEAKYYNIKEKKETTILATTGRGYFVLILTRSHHEPSDHILRDMNILGQNGKSMIPIVAMTEGEDVPNETLMNLLPIAHWGVDKDKSIEKMLQQGCQISEDLSLPVVAICDTFGRVVSISQGYTIGIGERVSNIINEITKEPVVQTCGK